MKDETMELMEMETETTENEALDYADEEGGSGKALGLVLAGLAGTAAVGVAVYKKIKAKKADKPKKKRKKWMRVEVDDEVAEENDEVFDSEADDVDEEPEAAEK